MDWLKEILEGLEGAGELEKKITAGIGKSFVSREDFNILNQSKKTLEGKITELEDAGGDTEKVQKELDDLKQTIADEKAEADRITKEQAQEADVMARFQSVVGENKWRDEITGKAVFGEFKAALGSEGNKGKGDREILEALTKDKNYYDNPNTPADMPSMGNLDMTTEEENKMRGIMGLPVKP